MKKNQILKVRLNDEMARKLSVVSEKERQTIQNEIIAMIRQKISYFERVKGNITREEINNANMEQFEEE
jgi:DNA-binding protein H-NS